MCFLITAGNERIEANLNLKIVGFCKVYHIKAQSFHHVWQIWPLEKNISKPRQWQWWLTHALLVLFHCQSFPRALFSTLFPFGKIINTGQKTEVEQHLGFGCTKRVLWCQEKLRNELINILLLSTLCDISCADEETIYGYVNHLICNEQERLVTRHRGYLVDALDSITRTWERLNQVAGLLYHVILY